MLNRVHRCPVHRWFGYEQQRRPLGMDRRGFSQPSRNQICLPSRLPESVNRYPQTPAAPKVVPRMHSAAMSAQPASRTTSRSARPKSPPPTKPVTFHIQMSNLNIFNVIFFFISQIVDVNLPIFTFIDLISMVHGHQEGHPVTKNSLQYPRIDNCLMLTGPLVGELTPVKCQRLRLAHSCILARVLLHTGA